MNIVLENNSLIKLGLGAGLAVLTYYLWPVFILVSISFILAAVLRPLHHLLTKVKIPSNISALLSTVCFISFIYFMLAFYIPFIFIELSKLGKLFNEQQFLKILETIIYKLNLHQYGLSTDSVQHYIFSHTLSSVEHFGSYIISILSEQGISLALLGVKSILVLVMTFHFLNNWNTWYKSIREYLSRRTYSNIDETVKKVDISITYWIKGQSIIVGILFGYYLMAFHLVHLPYIISLAALCALSSFVPYIGAIFASLLTFLVTANTHVLHPDIISSMHYIILGGVFISGNLIESHILVPYIIGNQIHMHPLVLMIYILCFAQVFGVYGMLFSLPVILIIHIILKSFLEAIRNDKQNNKEYGKDFRQSVNKAIHKRGS